VTLAEFTALIRLYQACADPVLRITAKRLVPTLAEWDERPAVEIAHEPYTAEQRERMAQAEQSITPWHDHTCAPMLPEK
jgi:hypothetical protein